MEEKLSLDVAKYPVKKKERISSDYTFIFLFATYAQSLFFLVIILVIIFFFSGEIAESNRYVTSQSGVVGLLILGVLFIALSYYYLLRKIVDVEIDENFIYLSRFAKTVKVPYQNIEKISRNFLFKDTRIRWLVFVEPVYFGKRVAFFPQMNKTFSFTNQRIKELKEKVKLKSAEKNGGTS